MIQERESSKWVKINIPFSWSINKSTLQEISSNVPHFPSGWGITSGNWDWMTDWVGLGGRLAVQPNVVVSRGAIHSTKIPTGATGKSGPPQMVDPFFRNFSGWTEPFH